MPTDGGNADLGTQLHGMTLDNSLDSPSRLRPKNLVEEGKKGDTYMLV